MHQEMMSRQKYGRGFEFLPIKLHTYQLKIIGGLHDQLDLVDQILKYFIGLVNDCLQSDQISRQIVKIGWRYGIMSLWNLIELMSQLLFHWQKKVSILECDLNE
jgi:hypothetical protein